MLRETESKLRHFTRKRVQIEVNVIVILLVFVDSNASHQQLLVLIMKRLRRRSRSTSKEGNDGVSLLCLPRSFLRRSRVPPSLPPAVKVSPVPAASSCPQRSTEVDEINHVEDVEQPGKNGVASGAGLLGGNGLQHYDRFIATLLRDCLLYTSPSPRDS